MISVRPPPALAAPLAPGGGLLAGPAADPWAIDAPVDAQIAAALERVRTTDEARRRHDVTNAQAAIDGAGSLLSGGGVLSDADRATLERVLVSGAQRLRALLDGDEDDAGPVSLAMLAEGVATEPRWYGRTSVDVAPDLVAIGRPGPIAEAIRQLLAAGRDLGAARPLVLRGRRDRRDPLDPLDLMDPLDPGTVGLWLPAGGASAAQQNLPVSFHVAARLVRDQGGEARVEVGTSGERSIGICLPAAGVPAGSDG